ncbi:HAMP domain-containing sensor histidine kinase [Paenibacillus sp. HB172176]|uniref:sensor histidine kinase n=1 Tax=Paenibacillus sp. HB172176 TaxID=2493690 RepID=UPI00143BF4C6|nr:HAMP domain-containing sensor histidine kinase [Paenibacillus sp. HB172176]
MKKRKLTKLQIFFRTSLAILAMFTFFGLTLSAGYLLSRWLYKTHQPSWNDYTVQLVNWGLGLLIFAIIAVLINIFTIPQQRRVWIEMMDALRRIAKGDFSVVIDQEKRYNGQIGAFVESINEMTQDLKEMEQLKQQFISNVSHEIQSPLTSIRGFARTLQREDLSQEERSHYLSIIIHETIRLSRLSDNLMKLTALESEEQMIDKSTYRLDKQLENITLACEPQWMDKKLDIELDLNAVDVHANEELLSQVWNNLIHNAIKFTPEGGSIRISLQLEVDATSTKGTADSSVIVVRVADSGIGISEEDVKHVFERFFKGDKQRTRTVEGNGLGLSIVEKIIDLHQGEIRVQSKLGEGTVFEVRLKQSTSPDGRLPIDSRSP